MPVMETIRRGTDSTLMKIVFGAIVLVFVFWGVGAQGPTSLTIATVNGKRITDTQFQRIMRRVDQGGSMDEADRKRLQQQVVDELVQTEVLLQEAANLGIEVSDEEIARKVLEVDDFKGNDGRFSKSYYEKALKRYGLTQGGFEAQLREQLTLQKLMELVAAGATVNDGVLEQRFRDQSTRLDLEYVHIPDEALLSQVPIDDAALDEFIAANKDMVRLQYDKDFDRLYNEPQKANLSMILLRADLDEGNVDDAQLQQRMATVKERAGAGEDFAALAREFSEDLTAVNGGVLGNMSESQLDTAVANAVFSTDAGSITGVVETSRGPALYKVSERIDAVTTPIEDVERDIARSMLADEKVGEVAKAFADEMLASWKEGELPVDKMQTAGLQLEASMAVTASSPTLGAIIPPPDFTGALGAVSEAGVLDSVYEVEGGRFIAKVSSYEAPDMDLFSAEKGALKTRVRMQEQQLFIEHWRKDIVARSEVEQLWIP